MFPKQQIDGFEKNWRRRKPSSSTALHYASDVRIFFKGAQGMSSHAIRGRMITLHMFYDYLAKGPIKTDEKVFLNRRGKPITITGIQLQLAKYCRQTDIWVTCHQLRHSFACRMIATGVPVTSVQKMLGHTSIRTTQIYVQVADTRVEQDYHAGIQKVIEICSFPKEVSRG